MHFAGSFHRQRRSPSLSEGGFWEGAREIIIRFFFSYLFFSLILYSTLFSSILFYEYIFRRIFDVLFDVFDAVNYVTLNTFDIGFDRFDTVKLTFDIIFDIFGIAFDTVNRVVIFVLLRLSLALPFSRTALCLSVIFPSAFFLGKLCFLVLCIRAVLDGLFLARRTQVAFTEIVREVSHDEP